MPNDLLKLFKSYDNFISVTFSAGIYLDGLEIADLSLDEPELEAILFD